MKDAISTQYAYERLLHCALSPPYHRSSGTLSAPSHIPSTQTTVIHEKYPQQYIL